MTKNTVDWTKPVEYEWDTGIWVSINPVYRDNDGVLFEVSDPQDGEKCRLYWPHKEINAYMFFRNVKESRAVHKDNRLDLTKPLEAFNTDTGKADLSDVVFIGPVADNSRNFPSWFICKWDNTRARELGFAGLDEDSYFLMRGDGKTDIPGLTVRNKETPKLKLPLEVGKTYRYKGNSVYPSGVWTLLKGDLKYWDKNGKYIEAKNSHMDFIEGPL